MFPSIRIGSNNNPMDVASIQCPKCQTEIPIDKVLTHQIEESVKSSYRQEMLKWKEIQEKKLQSELEAKNKQIEESKKRELGLLKKEQELEQKVKDADLIVARKLSEERQRIWSEAEEKVSSAHSLKEKEKDQLIESLKKSLEEAQRKASQGSQQLQGEVQELELEKVLASEFPYDEITPVAKGVNGADVTQKVRDTQGKLCGCIVWESKRTKNWSEAWISKLKEDLQLVKGDLAVLVTAVLPEGIKNFGLKDGIYVTSFECFSAVAKILRGVLIKEQSVKMSVVGKNEKMEVIFNYLSGSEFRQRVEAIVEAFSSMKDDLEQEKRAFQKIWAKREKEIDRVINNTVGMHGDLQGLMGASLPQIKGLQLDNFELIAASEVVSVEIEEP